MPKNQTQYFLLLQEALSWIKNFPIKQLQSYLSYIPPLSVECLVSPRFKLTRIGVKSNVELIIRKKFPPEKLLEKICYTKVLLVITIMSVTPRLFRSKKINYEQNGWSSLLKTQISLKSAKNWSQKIFLDCLVTLK